MQIAVVTTSYPAYEGDPAGHFVRAEVRALERGGRVTVIAPAPEEKERRGRVIWVEGGGAFGWPGVAARVRERPARAIGAVGWMVRARRALRALGPFERVVAHWSVPCGWPVAMGGGHELEVVSHGGDVRALLAMPSAGRAFLVRALATRASAWRFVAESLLVALTDGLGREDARRVVRIARVEACVLEEPPARLRRSAAEKRGERGGHPLYVCVGRLVPSKEFHRAIEHVAAMRPRPELVVVGDGPERARLAGLAAARGVRARFVGKVDREEALAWIGAADALVHASRAEGLCTVVREAEALGVRVLAL